jgi:hypothetical protein
MKRDSLEGPNKTIATTIKKRTAPKTTGCAKRKPAI